MNGHRFDDLAKRLAGSVANELSDTAEVRNPPGHILNPFSVNFLVGAVNNRRAGRGDFANQVRQIMDGDVVG